MPYEMNLIEAVNYKHRNPKQRVWYVYNLEDVYRGTHDYYEEDLVESRGEYKFDLNPNFSYPSYYDHESYGWSHFYNRHIIGTIFVETAEEYAERLAKEIEEHKLEIKKEQIALDKAIKRKEEELEKLKNKQSKK